MITEKIDGTNCCIIITEYGDIFAQSRHRILDQSESGDHFGFCKWVMGHQDELMMLGEGYHYGEWWGQGIQRNYGMDERIFSLFNPHLDKYPPCVGKVPIVAKTLHEAIARLDNYGSVAAPGFMNPEGLILRSCCFPEARFKYIINE